MRRKTLSPVQRVPVDGEPLDLVRQGEATSVVVVADNASDSAMEAARELIRVVERCTGAVLPLHRESECPESGLCRVLVGDSNLSRAMGFDPEALPEEGALLRTSGQQLLLAGRELGEHGLPVHGTRRAVVLFLEQQLGVRWLWPGPLGEVIPSKSNLVVHPLHEVHAPVIRLRRIRNRGIRDQSIPGPDASGDDCPGERNAYTTPHDPGEPARWQVCPRICLGLRKLEVDPAQRRAWVPESCRWFVRNHLGDSFEPIHAHAFEGWWEEFGQKHPDWFALQPHPGRGREQKPPREQLCVSNPALIEKVADAAIHWLQEHPGCCAAPIGPNDGSPDQTFCMCEECRKLDPANGSPVQLIQDVNGERIHASYVSLTDRFLSFYSKVAARVAAVLPGKMVCGYIYSRYREPALRETVHPALMIVYVGFSYFDDAALEKHRREWETWACATDKLYFRPNFLLEGHGLPAVYVKKMARDIRRLTETGMRAADISAVNHHWSTQGLNYYALARLLWDPSLDPSALVDDYCRAGFGPAASVLRRYFEEIEEITNRIAAARADSSAGELEIEMDWLPVHGGFESRFFPEETLQRLESLLSEARRMADGHDEILSRIDFLAVGLRFSRLQVELREAVREKRADDEQRVRGERLALAHQLAREEPLAVGVDFLFWREGAFSDPLPDKSLPSK